MFVAVAIGGYMAAGAANTINMVIDRDIDGRMARTAKRPTVTQYISSRNALLFALTLAVGSCLLLSRIRAVRLRRGWRWQVWRSMSWCTR